MKLESLISAAYESKSGLRKLNLALRFGIPFNKPHKFSIDEIKPGFVRATAPLIRKNKNHLNGIHACCLATLSELTCGLALMSCLEPAKYRLIMSNMEVSYKYQAKTAAHTRFEISLEKLQEEVITPLKTEDSVDFNAEIEVFDDSDRLVCTTWVKWQIKDWEKVRTKR